jgi:hypothetical protein
MYGITDTRQSITVLPWFLQAALMIVCAWLERFLSTSNSRRRIRQRVRHFRFCATLAVMRHLKGFVVFCALAAVFLVPRAAALEVGERVRVPFVAEPGMRFAVTIEKTRRRVENGKQTRKVETKQSYIGEVLGTAGAGYRIRWVLTSFDSPQTLSGTAAQIARLLIGIALEFETDLKGRPTRLVGWPKTRNKVIGVIRKLKVKTQAERRVWRQVTGAFRQYTSQTAARILLREAALLAHTQNFTLPYKKPVIVKNTVANPLGGPRIALVTAMQLVRYDKTADEAEIKWRSQFDPENAKRAILEGFRLLARRMNRKIEDFEAMAKDFTLARTDRFSAVISLTTGWTMKTSLDRHIQSGLKGELKERFETWRLTVRRLPRATPGPPPVPDKKFWIDGT